ncbi:N-acylneuraminate-9-phosphatase [Gadus chalcogrammus]|uniref:N-acylneuraminate-9-phosphatase n=1 Tax=Gadus chalcogrammus TaxID=1042646 RepID=UPI0024C48B6A|nr:N-acylneuraminate-9-phosphatase [Gadus chalcogrammus]
MDRKPIEAILFDLDNTLIETALASRVAIEKTNDYLRKTRGLADVSLGHISEKFKHKLQHETFDPTSGGSIDELRVDHWEQSIQEVAGSCTRSLADECYYLWKSSRLELLSLSPETCALLEALRTRYKLLLLTNGETQTQREKIIATKCEKFFDFIVVGGEFPEQKPAVSIFNHCFTVLGVEAKRCVMVGDSLDTDIQGGFDAGVRATVWIKNSGASQDVCTAKPDYTIPTVLDLPGILVEFNE